MRSKSIYLATALALCSIGTMAAELDAFVAARDGATTCWSRQYDANHLAAHPDQQVTAMSLTVTFMDQSEINPEQYVFRLEADLRDGRHGQASGPCRADGDKMWCGVECDGGGILISTRSGGDVLADLAHTGAISMSSSCGEENFEDGFSLAAGVDDRAFLLHALPARLCVPAKY